jgi:hypothetical protein
MNLLRPPSLLRSPVNPLKGVASNSDVNQNEEKQLTLKSLLWILLIFALVAIIRTSSRNAKWGYGPSIGIGLVALIVLILVLSGYI